MRKIIVGIVMLITAGVILSAATPAKKTTPAKRAAVAAKTTTPSQLKTEQEKLSYALGMDIANRLKSLKANVDVKLFNKAVSDALSGAKPMMSQKEAGDILKGYFQKMRQAEQAKMNVEAQKNLAAGRAFLAKNKTQPGVVTLPDGLQYLVIKKGAGVSPTTNDEVTLNYSGTLIDGTEFDSSYLRGKPAVFPVNHVIKGFKEGLQHMKPGGKYRLFIPAKLAYGQRGAGKKIGPNSTLIFDIDLISVKPVKKKAPSAKPIKGKRATVKTK